MNLERCNLMHIGTMTREKARSNSALETGSLTSKPVGSTGRTPHINGMNMRIGIYLSHIFLLLFSGTFDVFVSRGSEKPKMVRQCMMACVCVLLIHLLYLICCDKEKSVDMHVYTYIDIC